MGFFRQYGLLLGGLGFSNLGNWIYLIALNLAVWHLTHSPAAVAGIYIAGPIARIFSNFFVGSIIDRHDKKRLMIYSDIVRGIIVGIMPFAPSIWVIYSLIFFANIASSFFGPSSTYMITKLVKDEDKLRFNALNSTLSYGSFMIGPALAGGIIAISNTGVAIISFVALGFFMAFSNTGYATMYQKTIPPDLMGRFGSSLDLIQSIAQIILTFSLGILAEWFSLQIVAVTFSTLSLILAVYLYFYIVSHTKELSLVAAKYSET